MKTRTNSAAAKQRAYLKNVQTEILSTCDLTEDDYWHLEFECGCLFIEHIQFDPSYRDSLLMNKENGFWNWWRYQWMLDNQQLIDTAMIGNELYSELKKAMSTDALLRDRLFDFLSM